MTAANRCVSEKSVLKRHLAIILTPHNLIDEATNGAVLFHFFQNLVDFYLKGCGLGVVQLHAPRVMVALKIESCISHFGHCICPRYKTPRAIIRRNSERAFSGVFLFSLSLPTGGLFGLDHSFKISDEID